MEWFSDVSGVGWLVPAVSGGFERIYLYRKMGDRLATGGEQPGVDVVLGGDVLQLGEVGISETTGGKSVHNRITQRPSLPNSENL